MTLHFGLRFYLIFAEVLGFKKIQVSNNKWRKLLSDFYYNFHFVFFLSYYLLYLALDIAQISLDRRGEAEKDIDLNDALSTFFSYLFWFHGVIYCCLSFVLLIYTRIYSKKLLCLVRKFRRHSRCKENYLYFGFSSFQALTNICFAISNLLLMYFKLKDRSIIAATFYSLTFFHIWINLLNYQCLYICFTEQISSSFKVFLNNVTKLEKIQNKMFLYPNNDDKEKAITGNLKRILFSRVKILEEFYSYFQKPICFLFAINLYFLIFNITRVSMSASMRNSISSLQALYLAFLIIFLSDIVNEQVC